MASDYTFEKHLKRLAEKLNESDCTMKQRERIKKTSNNIMLDPHYTENSDLRFDK